MNRYTATAERSGEWWAISVRELPGLFTQARRIDQVEDTVRDAIGLLNDGAKDLYEVDVVVKFPDELEAARERVFAHRKAADETAHRYAKELVAAAKLSEKLGLSQRDAGRLVGVSFQRIGQVLQSAGKSTLSAGKAAPVSGQRVAAKAAAKSPAKAAAKAAAKVASGRPSAKGRRS